MEIDFLPPVALPREPVAAVSGAATRTPAVSFSTLVSDGLRGVSERLHASEADLQRLAAGQADDLHRVMIGLEESRLSLQLLLQVRNRLLESYQDVVRMQL